MIDSLTEQLRDRTLEFTNASTKCTNLQAAVDDLSAQLLSKTQDCERLENENRVQKHRIDTLVEEVQGLTADKVGLETTLQSKNATIDDLGINLNNTQLEHQRLQMVANHNLALTETALTTGHPYSAYGHHNGLLHGSVAPLTSALHHGISHGVHSTGLNGVSTLTGQPLTYSGLYSGASPTRFYGNYG